MSGSLAMVNDMAGSKNRFLIEGDEGDIEYVAGDDRGAYSGETIYLDEPDPRHRRRRLWFSLSIWGGLILFLLITGGIFYYYKFMQAPAEDDAAAQEFQRIAEELQDRYYLPTGDFTSDLQSAIDLFYSKDYGNSEIRLKKFVESDATPQEKAVALNYLAVMAMDRERFELARYYLVQALKNQDDSIPTLVNLAIVERRLNEHEQAREYAERARELAPRDSRVALLLGNILAESQNVEEAIEIYEEAIGQQNDDPLLYYNAALQYLKRERYDEAILSFSKAIDSAGPGSIAVQSHAHLGQIYFRRGNYELAAHHLELAVKMAPDNGKYLYNLGVIQLQMGQEERALYSFRRAMDAGTNEPIVYRSLARALERMQEPQLAERALQNALHLNPQDLPTLFALGDLQQRQHDLLAAAETYKRIVNITPGDQNTEEALFQLASIYVEMERGNDAIDVLEKAANLNPDNPRVYYLLGRVYATAGKNELALQAWKKALSPVEGQVGVSDAPPLARDQEREIRLAMGDLYRRQGGFELALKQYQLILDRNQQAPRVLEDPEVDLAIGRTYMLIRDYRNAIASFEKVSTARQASTEMRRDAFMQLAQAHAGLGGRDHLEQARSNVNKAVRMDPLDYDARIMQASILMETDSMVDREKAIEILKSVVESDIDARRASRAHNLMGVAYMKNSEFNRALQEFDYAVQLDPTNNEAYQNRRVAQNAYQKNL
ncbi:MAG: tetratricopeptide repeat protein [Leptospiraceae bacterium]|nr:tetratricopeptide repeat protein [Leptospiraceae bacterium]